MRIELKSKGNFRNTDRYLNKLKRFSLPKLLNKYGKLGVDALISATPKDSGETATSWYYTVARTNTGYSLSFSNSKMAGSVPLVILLNYGHGTRGGTYVPGRNFINPALLPVINNLSRDLWKEVLYG